MKLKEVAHEFYSNVFWPEVKKTDYYLDQPRFKPSRVVLVVSENCNMRCKQCHTWQKVHHDKPLTLEEYKKILLDLRKWLGPVTVAFGGGEPFMNKDLLKIIDYARGLGFSISMTTNASLITPEAAKKISSFEKLYLAISLDGIKPETHDYLRGVPGTYKKVMRVIDSMDKHYVSQHLTISTVLMGYNIDEILPLVNFVKEKNISTIGFQALAPTIGEPYYSTWYKDNSLFPRTKKQKEKMLKVIDALAEMKKKDWIKDDMFINSFKQLQIMKDYFVKPYNPVYQKCYLGVDNFVIDGFGKVRLCFNMPPIGNVRNKAPQKIWRSKEAVEARKQIRNCKRECTMMFCTYTPSFSENLYKWRELKLNGWLAAKKADAKSLFTSLEKSKETKKVPTRNAIDIERFEKFLKKKHPELVKRYNVLCMYLGTYFGKRFLIATHYKRLGGCVY